MLVCAFFDAHCTRDRGCGAHPVFPAPSDFGGKVSFKTPGASRREIAHLCQSRLTEYFHACQGRPDRPEK
jgi:hypothetical protein